MVPDTPPASDSLELGQVCGRKSHPLNQCRHKVQRRSRRPGRMGSYLSDSRLALLGSSSGAALNCLARISHLYFLQRMLGQMGQPRQKTPLHGWSRRHHCSTEMGFIMFWLQVRGLFYFHNCDSAKHPSPQEIAIACLANEAQIYLCWNHSTSGHGGTDRRDHSSSPPNCKDEEQEASSGNVTCPRTHSWLEIESGKIPDGP